MIDLSEWAPLGAAAIAGIAALGVQMWISRGEPAAMKRVRLLNEAITAMPAEDPGALALVEARSILSARLARALIGLSGAALFLRRAGWVSSIGGSGLLIGSITLGLLDPSILVSDKWKTLFAWGFGLLLAGPVIMFYSALWPEFSKTMDEVSVAIGRARGSRSKAAHNPPAGLENSEAKDRASDRSF